MWCWFGLGTRPRRSCCAVAAASVRLSGLPDEGSRPMGVPRLGAWVSSARRAGPGQSAHTLVVRQLGSNCLRGVCSGRASTRAHPLAYPVPEARATRSSGEVETVRSTPRGLADLAACLSAPANREFLSQRISCPP
jgi:hypothetical protein